MFPALYITSAVSLMQGRLGQNHTSVSIYIRHFLEKNRGRSEKIKCRSCLALTLIPIGKSPQEEEVEAEAVLRREVRGTVWTRGWGAGADRGARGEAVELNRVRGEMHHRQLRVVSPGKSRISEK